MKKHGVTQLVYTVYIFRSIRGGRIGPPVRALPLFKVRNYLVLVFPLGNLLVFQSIIEAIDRLVEVVRRQDVVMVKLYASRSEQLQFWSIKNLGEPFLSSDWKSPVPESG